MLLIHSPSSLLIVLNIFRINCCKKYCTPQPFNKAVFNNFGQTCNFASSSSGAKGLESNRAFDDNYWVGL